MDKCCGTCTYYKAGFCVVTMYSNGIKIEKQKVLESNFCHLWEQKETEEK